MDERILLAAELLRSILAKIQFAKNKVLERRCRARVGLNSDPHVASNFRRYHFQINTFATPIDFNNSTVLDGNNVPICRNEYDHLLYNDQDDQGSLEDNNWLNDSDVSIEPNSDSNNGIENSLPIDSVRDNRLSFACGATVTIICKLESYFLAFRIYFVKIGKYFLLQTHYLLQTSIFCFVAL